MQYRTRQRTSPQPYRCVSDHGPGPYVVDLKGATLENTYFRSAIWTGPKLQTTLMSILPGEEIGFEVHENTDQFLYIVQGRGIARFGCPGEGNLKSIGEGSGVFVPAGTRHNIVNTGSCPLKLFSVYAPPEHPPCTVHKTRAEAEEH